jgi:hypothetical protein
LEEVTVPVSSNEYQLMLFRRDAVIGFAVAWALAAIALHQKEMEIPSKGSYYSGIACGIATLAISLVTMTYSIYLCYK